MNGELTERERRILAMWPRYEDDEPVWIGDEATNNKNQRFTVKRIEFRHGKWMLNDSVTEGHYLNGKFGERADGVPVRVTGNGDRAHARCVQPDDPQSEEAGRREVRVHGGREREMNYVNLGDVRTFANVKADKAQALKVLEEAAEVVEAFKRHSEAMAYDPESVYAESSHRGLMDEIADTIQASCNLAAALGVTDLTPHLARCEERNRRRGRYDR